MTDADYKTVAAHLMGVTSRRPTVGIICGSGLSMLANSLENAETFKYEDIPGMPSATVQGHSGELIFGTMDGLDVVCMKGRFHFYEGHSMQNVVLPVRVMRLMGVKLLVVTNASGGLKKEQNVGDIVVIQDHFAIPILAGNNPLRGVNDPLLGDRFPSVSDAYDDTLQAIIMKLGDELGMSDILRPDGVYCFVSGPSYESKAECRFLSSIGGDTVGMSTVPEVLAAKHCGMKVLTLSFVTNKVIFSDDQGPAASHAEVMEAVTRSGANLELLVKTFVTRSSIGEYLYNCKPAPVFDYKAHKHCGKAGCTCGPNCKCDNNCKCDAASGSTRHCGKARCTCGPNCQCGDNCNCDTVSHCNTGCGGSSDCCKSKEECPMKYILMASSAVAVIAGIFFLRRR